MGGRGVSLAAAGDVTDAAAADRVILAA